jgi:hypothetical protein
MMWQVFATPHYSSKMVWKCAWRNAVLVAIAQWTETEGSMLNGLQTIYFVGK